MLHNYLAETPREQTNWTRNKKWRAERERERLYCSLCVFCASSSYVICCRWLVNHPFGLIKIHGPPDVNFNCFAKWCGGGGAQIFFIALRSWWSFFQRIHVRIVNMQKASGEKRASSKLVHVLYSIKHSYLGSNRYHIFGLNINMPTRTSDKFKSRVITFKTLLFW